MKNTSERIRIRCGEVYTTADVMEAMGVSRETIQKWKRNRHSVQLKSYRPDTKAEFFIGDDIIQFLREYVPQGKRLGPQKRRATP